MRLHTTAAATVVLAAAVIFGVSQVGPEDGQFVRFDVIWKPRRMPPSTAAVHWSVGGHSGTPIDHSGHWTNVVHVTRGAEYTAWLSANITDADAVADCKITTASASKLGRVTSRAGCATSLRFKARRIP